LRAKLLGSPLPLDRRHVAAAGVDQGLQIGDRHRQQA
jgi:hypothetical protein